MSTKKPARKSATKKAEPQKPVRAAAAKPVKTVSKSASPKAAARTVKPVKKTPLKKAVAGNKVSAAVRKTGTAKETSGPKSKPVKMSAAKKPVKTVGKPLREKADVPSGKSARAKAEKIPAPAKAGKVTGKKPKPAISVRTTGKKTAVKLPALSPGKTEVKEKAPAPAKKAAEGIKLKTTKRPYAAGIGKKPVRAVDRTKKAGELKQKKTSAKTAAQKTAPAKPAVKPARKAADLQQTGEKEKKPAVRKKTVTARVVAQPVEEQKAPVPKAQRKPRTVGEAAAAKVPVKKGPARRPAVAAKKTIEREPAVPQAEERERPKLKIFLPGKEAEEEYLRESAASGLPEEYGENAVIAMAVDPNTIFVDWEIVPSEIAGREGDLTLRFNDITGVEFDGGNANASIDIGMERRVGNGFFVINMPGRDVVVEAGIIGPAGGFHVVVRSDIVSFPFLLSFDDLGIVQKLLAAGIPVGY